jgi:hypothetical protein
MTLEKKDSSPQCANCYPEAGPRLDNRPLLLRSPISSQIYHLHVLLAQLLP